MKKIMAIMLGVLSLTIAKAQEGFEYSETMTVLYSTVFNGDTIPYVNIPDVTVISYTFPTAQERNKYEITKRKVEKIYPYYLIAKEVILEMEEVKSNSRKKEFKKFKKDRKKELMNEFEKELRDLKVSEGKILVKMINRNTGLAFYDLIKDYNSNTKAWIYNIVAKKYGYDLKAEYNPDDLENYYLELALKSIEASNW